MYKRFIKVFMLLIGAFASTTVLAEGDKIDGIITISSPEYSEYICYYGADDSGTYHDYGYMYHKYSFRFTDDATKKAYPAFCVKPGASVFINNSDGILAAGENAVECEIMTAEEYPRVYSFIDQAQAMWNYQNNSERDYYDFLLRLASIGDQYDDYINKKISYSNNSNMKSFMNSYLVDVLGEDPYSDKITYHGKKVLQTYHNCSDDSSTVKPYDQAIENLKKIEEFLKTNPPSSKTTSSITTATGTKEEMSGATFTIKLVEEQELYAIYDVTSEQEVNNVKVTPSSNATVTWVTAWNKKSGRIKVNKKTSTTCNISITIEGDNQVDGAAVYYCTHKRSSSYQSFVTIGPGKIADKFKLDLDCTGCSSVGCAAAKHAKDFIEKDIHNCCDGQETKVRQQALDELFCEYSEEGLVVPYYKPRCNANEYITETKSYCEVYCGVTAMYKMPGPTRSMSDRGFEFTTLETGIAGPVLEQYKRCRIVIKFDQWYNDYSSIVDNMISTYQDNQYSLAAEKMWDDMIKDGKTDSRSAFNVTCTAKANDQTGTGIASVSAASIKYYPASQYSSKYTYATLKHVVNGDYSKSSVVIDKMVDVGDNGTYYDDTEATAYENTVKSAVSTATTNAKNNLPADLRGSATVSCNYSSEYSIGTHVNASDKKKEHAEHAAAALTNYNVYVGRAVQIKKDLDSCGGTIDESNNKDASNIEKLVAFKGEPEMEFSYTSKFYDDFGNIQDSELLVDFKKTGGDEEGKCISEIKTSFLNSDHSSADWNENWDIKGWFPDRYDSKKYKQGKMTISDMNKMEASKLETQDEVKARLNNSYVADKKFTTDGVNHMTCKWTDTENTSYIVIPFGYVTETIPCKGDCDKEFYVQDGAGKLKKGYRHYMGKTVARGKFETYFTLKNVGDGIIDDVIHEEGKTCSGRSDIINYNGTPVNATCYYYNWDETQTLLDCNRKEVVSIKDIASAVCDETEKKVYIEYKEVDPTALFPNDVTYGWNWKSSEEGPAVLAKIQEMAKQDKTYAPENLTYSFTLTPKDLRAIREYNKSRVAYGGYNDFDMDCVIPEQGAATQCKSKFLDAISGGKLNYGSSTLSLKTNNTDLRTLRKNW